MSKIGNPGNGLPLTDRPNIPRSIKDRAPANLRKAAEGMEATFMNMLVKQMRASVPESEATKNNKSLQIFREMLDQEYSEKASKNQGIGLAEVIIRQMLEQSQGQPFGKIPVRPLNDSDIIDKK